MATPTSKCGSFLTPIYQIFRKIITRDVFWQDMSNFLSVILEEFPVNVQQYLPIYGINDE